MRIPSNAIPRQTLAPRHAASARQFDDMQVANKKAGAKGSPPSVQQPAGSLDITAGPTSTASLNAPPEMSLEGLMAAWGTNDARYDLNNDQTVDVNDLVEFVERFPQDAGDDSKANPAVDQTGDGTEPTLTTPPPPAAGVEDVGGDAGTGLTLEGLYAAWGRNDAAYDLNGDKTVDVNDLVAFTERMTPQEIATPTAAETLPVADTSPDPTGDPAPPTLAGLMAAWGTADEMYDLNGDRTVDVNDLVQFIEEQGGARPDVAATAVAGGVADKIGDLMGRVLSAAGFSNQLPTNLAELMDEMKVETTARKGVVDRLSSRFPGGLGINAVG